MVRDLHAYIFAIKRLILEDFNLAVAKVDRQISGSTVDNMCTVFPRNLTVARFYFKAQFGTATI